MKTLYTIIFLSIVLLSNANAQYPYRTFSSGNWTDPIWQVLDTAGVWTNILGYPQSSSDTDDVGSIIIRAGNTVTISSNINATEIYDSGTVMINAARSLNVGKGYLILSSSAGITGPGSIKTNSVDIYHYVSINIAEDANFNVDLEVLSGLTVIGTQTTCYMQKKITVASGARIYFPNNSYNTINYYLNGEIINNGKLIGYFLHFKGPKITNNDTMQVDISIDTNCTIEGTGIWTYYDLTVSSNRILKLLSNIELQYNLNLEAGSYLDLNSKTLTLNYVFQFQSLNFKVDSLASTSTTGLIKILGPVYVYSSNNFGEIKSEVRVMSGTTTVLAIYGIAKFSNKITVESGATLTGTLLIKGDFINNGTLTGNCICKSPNFSNYGSVSAALDFDSVTNIQGNGEWKYDYTIKESRSVALLSDISLSQCDLTLENNSTLNLNTHTLNYAGALNSGGGIILDSNSAITNSGLVNMIGNNNGIQNNFGNFNVPLKINSGITTIVSNIVNYEPSVLNNTVTVDSSATLQGNSQINGNLINNGTIDYGSVRFFGTSLTNNGYINPVYFKFESTDNSLHSLLGTGSFGAYCLITNGTRVAANSNHQFYELTIDSGGTFDITNRTIKVSGYYPLTNNGTFITSSSTIEFNSINNQSMPVVNINYNNIIINCGGKVYLSGNVTVPSELNILNGDLELTYYVITLTPTATLSETPGNTVTETSGGGGFLTTTRNLNAPSNLNVGGLGAILTTTANLGMTEIRRSHWYQNGFYGPYNVLRVFDIIPANNNGLNATLGYKYDESEIVDSLPESGLGLFKSTDDGTSFSYAGGTVDTAINQITLDSVNDFSRWTAGLIAAPVAANIKLVMEAFLNTGTLQLNSRDTVKAYLANSSSPFNIIDSAISVIDSLTFTGSFLFADASSGNYYIVIKHRNSIETWSKSGGDVYILGSVLSYDFTVSQSQAYGDNLKQISGYWCIYSGDVNNDGTIDIGDLGLIENDSYNFTGGYTNTDVNGDGIVDLNDLSIADNNGLNFVSVIKP